MKSQNVAAPVAPNFFSLNGNYQVAPGTTCNDLHDDIGCWLESIHSTVDMIIDGLQEEGGQIAANPNMVAQVLYGVRYQVEMVKGALSASHKLGA